MAASSSLLHGGLLLLLPLLTTIITTAASSSAPLALLSLKSSLHDPSSALSPWTYASASASATTPSQSPPPPPWCAWPGVSCDPATGDISGLDLSRRNLSGTISATAATLLAPTLTSLNLSGNAFSGQLPTSLFHLRRLRSLDVSHNLFNGTFPSGVAALAGTLTVLDAYSNCFVGPLPPCLGELRHLRRLNLGGSFFNGTIPAEIIHLRSLRFLHLAGNALTGRIPPELGALASLERLEIGYNSYSDGGGVPTELGNLTRLKYLDIAVANLSGHLPPELGDLVSLENLFLFKNRLTGGIPPTWSRLNALQSLDLSDNHLAGTVPPCLGHLANLTVLNLMSNSLTGAIPPTIGELPSLEVLQLWNNSLTGELPAALGTASRRLVRVDVSSNFLSGSIPPGICAGGRLARLILFGNRFDSPIPASLAACPSLCRVRLESNRLSGEIPAGFGELRNLTYLDLSSNDLTGGGVPADLFSSPSLEYVNVSGNLVGGELPNVTWQAPNLQVFAASQCDLVGDVPAFGAAAGGCSNLYRLELAGNELTGAIPEDIGTCKRLVSLRLQHNQLTGEIPAELAALPSITEIDLSWNDLTGVVPPGFANSTTLETFDVSFNVHLVATADGSPPSASASRDAAGEGTTSARRTAATMWVSAVAVAFAGMAVLAVTARWLQWREDAGGGGGARRPNNVVVGPWRMTAFQRLEFTAADVARCVEGSGGGGGGIIVGAGSSGTVYRAKMPNGEVIAVKKLWRQPSPDKQEAGGGAPAAATLSSEVEVLGHLRHRNIVRLLGWCTDGETTLLLYEYMPNGSLDELLHGGAAGGKAAAAALGWEARHRIAVGVAQGVSYLHHDCVPAVAHRDLKPSNILLDADMEPRVADFGVAKALVHHGGAAMTMSVVAGSYGYIAPEYTYTLKVDEKSDVYSFGVVLLEILTGRRAVEPEYGEGSSIVDWVRRKVAAAAGAGDVMDAAAWADGGEEAAREEMAMVMRVALLCTSRCPQERPAMRDVVSMLQEAKRGRRLILPPKKQQQAQPDID